MNATDILFTIANGFFFVGTLPMIVAAVKNRNALKGFSWFGAYLTFVGMLSMILAMFILQQYISVVLQLPVISYWAIVSIYSK